MSSANNLVAKTDSLCMGIFLPTALFFFSKFQNIRFAVNHQNFIIFANHIWQSSTPRFFAVSIKKRCQSCALFANPTFLPKKTQRTKRDTKHFLASPSPTPKACADLRVTSGTRKLLLFIFTFKKRQSKKIKNITEPYQNNGIFCFCLSNTVDFLCGHLSKETSMSSIFK